MAMALRAVGGLMMAYAAVYTAQFFFDTLYTDSGRVWSVFNFISAAGILVSLATNFLHMRSQATGEPATLARLGAYALFYANAALAIWFFRNWIDLLALEEGESVSVHSDVVWMFIAVMIPLVFATTGWRLWRTRP